MPSNHPSDDQIIAEVARQNRVTVSFLVSMAALIAVTVILVLLAAKAHLMPAWLPDPLVTVLFLTWLGYVLFRVKPSNPAFDLSDESYLRKTVERRQRQWRYFLCVMLLGILVQGWSWSFVISRGAMKTSNLLVPLAGAFALAVLFGVLALTYGPRPFSPEYAAGNDELNRVQRVRATQLGYVFTVMELCALLAAAAWHPQWALLFLPAAIAMAVAVPVLIFSSWNGRRGAHDRETHFRS